MEVIAVATIAAEIARLLLAWREKVANGQYDGGGMGLDRIRDEFLPRGGQVVWTKIALRESSVDRLIFHVKVRDLPPLLKNGATHVILAYATFAGIDVTVEGRKNARSWLRDMFEQCLSEPLPTRTVVNPGLAGDGGTAFIRPGYWGEEPDPLRP